jgi:hypothetical protein
MQSDQIVGSTIFEKWNRALLWLLAIEMSYLVSAILVDIGWLVDSRWIDSWLFSWRSNDFIPLSLLPLVVLYLVNFGGAFGTLVLALRRKQDYSINEWIGHILNWIYVVVMSWPYIVLTLVWVTSHID